jgi:hypothetical protein
VNRTGQVIVMAGMVAAVAAAGHAAPPRARGFDRFLRPCPALTLPEAPPACVRAPSVDAPWPSPDAPRAGVLSEEGPPLSACFDPDFPPPWEVQLAVGRAMHEVLTDRFNIAGSWPGADNLPITLTWSFVPDGLNIPPGSGIGDPAGPSELFANLDARFGGDRALWIAQFEAVFARWAQLSGVSYQRITVGGNPWDDGAAWGTSGAAGLRGDVRIGMHPIDGQFGIIAYNSYPSGGDMVLDSAENWGSSSNNYRYLRNTVGHEHGHGLGLAHVCPRNNTKLMEPFITVQVDGPQQDEIRGVQRMYGDPYEPNGDANAPTSLGVIDVGVTLTPSEIPPPAVANAALTSLAINDEVDRYLVSTGPRPVLITATVTPVGSLYADYVQDAACNNSVATTDAARLGNLRIQLLSSTGTQIRDANSTGFGQSESIVQFLASPGTDYILRVSETATLTEPQLYSLVVTGAAAAFAASDGTLADRVRLTWDPIPTASLYTLFRGTSTSRASATQLAIASSSSTSFDDVTAVAGVTYYYWLEATITGLSGSRPAAGPDAGFRASAPANDSCGAAAAIAAGPPVAFNSTLATTDGPVEGACGQGATWMISGDIWYSFTPGVSGPYIVRTCSSGFDTRVAVYAACPSVPDQALACGDDAPGCAAQGASVRWFAASGVSYRLRVGGPMAGGLGQVQVLCPGDYNRSGEVGVQDVFDFLAAFFAGLPDADVNGASGVTIQDIFDYLGWYLGGC